MRKLLRQAHERMSYRTAFYSSLPRRRGDATDTGCPDASSTIFGFVQNKANPAHAFVAAPLSLIVAAHPATRYASQGCTMTVAPILVRL